MGIFFTAGWVNGVQGGASEKQLDALHEKLVSLDKEIIFMQQHPFQMDAKGLD